MHATQTSITPHHAHNPEIRTHSFFTSSTCKCHARSLASHKVKLTIVQTDPHTCTNIQTFSHRDSDKHIITRTHTWTPAHTHGHPHTHMDTRTQHTYTNTPTHCRRHVHAYITTEIQTYTKRIHTYLHTDTNAHLCTCYLAKYDHV